MDGEVVDLEAGSAVRVSTGHSRCMKNTGEGVMVYLCVQSRENSLAQWVMEDAVITEMASAL